MVDGKQGKRVYGFGPRVKSLLKIGSSNNHRSTHAPNSVNSKAIIQFNPKGAYEKQNDYDTGNSKNDGTRTDEDDDSGTSKDDDE
ncbi:hypothetical protein M9H77_26777 [Catharanthus roseus]|uniref:Uncharacterized protein n=1 Tax=Catharanthus roseus TaxID=4058 RepID=A0ACC0AAY6_CATRO|nr:hypothetical protein M9H77_26777 [Catharanthus roseus]